MIIPTTLSNDTSSWNDLIDYDCRLHYKNRDFWNVRLFFDGHDDLCYEQTPLQAFCAYESAQIALDELRMITCEMTDSSGDEYLVELLRIPPYTGSQIAYALKDHDGEFNYVWDDNEAYAISTLIYNVATLSFVFSAAEEFQRLRCNLTDVQFDPEILHIHGSLQNDVVLGVDNERQLQCLPYPLSVRGKRAFIKPYFNEQYDARRVLEARKMIEDSEVVCIFGFSMGESDRMWIQLLAEWLCRNANHHLIYYEYDEHLYAPCNYDEIMDAEEEKKQRLLKRLGLGSKDAIDKQVHIPIKEKIFAFDLKRGIKEFEQEVMENQRRYREYSRTK